MKNLKTNLKSKIKVLDIDISYNEKKYVNLKIHYEVEYCPIV